MKKEIENATIKSLNEKEFLEKRKQIEIKNLENAINLVFFWGRFIWG